MNHLKFQSLAFYGVAIGSVLILFKVVTTYGEANVKAPAPIEGRYRLALEGSIPNCSPVSNLVLGIQQSGIYLNGFLSPAQISQDSSTAAEKSSLTGALNNQQLLLSGKVPTNLCSNPAAWDANSVTIQAQIQKESLAGKLVLSASKEFKFTALRENPPQSTQNSSNH